jgi:hypothetical protein
MVKNLLEVNNVPFKEVNISEDESAVETYDIMSTPVTILLDEGEEVVRVNGYKVPDLHALIDQL